MVEQCLLAVNITDAVRELRKWPGRSSGYIEPLRGRARWVGYEGDLEEGILRIDAKLPSGAECGSVLELFPQAIGSHRDRVRWTVACPGCGSSVRHLYIASASAPEWGCRACLGLVHRSTRHRRPARAAYEIQHVRRDLGVASGPIFEPPVRPKGMHHETFSTIEEGIRRRLDEYAADANRRRRARTRLASLTAP